jgi:serine/threonine-protein kinase
MSRDGSTLVFRSPPPSAQLWVRRWQEVSAVPIPGTEGAALPSISPDGQQVAFTQAGQVRVISIAGGAARTLAAGTAPFWGADRFVYMTSDSGIVRVPETGGPAEPLTRLAIGESEHVITDLLPGERVALLTALRSAGADIRTLDLSSGQTKAIATGVNARYSPSGHLTFSSRDGVLHAARFDPDRQRLLGPPVVMRDNVASYSLSASGDLFFSTGALLTVEPTWVTPAGVVTPVDSTWRVEIGPNILVNSSWSLSPDGGRIAVRERTQDGFDIWIKEIGGGRYRLTSSPGDERMARWHPDGKSVTYLSDEGASGDLNLWSRRADGTGKPELLADVGRPLGIGFWSPDGKSMILRTAGSSGRSGRGIRDILVMSPGTDRVPRPLLDEDYDFMDPALSPDNRWIAYHSDESGRFEVYVRPFPEVEGGKTQISTSTGVSPLWSPDGREVMYLESSPTGPRAIAVRFDTAAGFRVLDRRVLFALAPRTYGESNTVPWDIAPDGRFLMGREISRVRGSVFLHQGWIEEVKRATGDVAP